jgi:hypothetical protein
MKIPLIIAEGSSMFSQLRVVMLYGSSKPASTTLKPTNEVLTARGVNRMGEAFKTASTHILVRPALSRIMDRLHKLPPTQAPPV